MLTLLQARIEQSSPDEELSFAKTQELFMLLTSLWNIRQVLVSLITLSCKPDAG